MLTATVAGGKLPFVSTYAGALTLVLVSVISTWLFTYVTSNLRKAADRNDTQTRLLIRLTEAVIPENRKSLVERVETLETNLEVLSREIESGEAVDLERRATLVAEIAEVKRSCERLLDSLPSNR